MYKTFQSVTKIQTSEEPYQFLLDKNQDFDVCLTRLIRPIYTVRGDLGLDLFPKTFHGRV